MVNLAVVVLLGVLALAPLASTDGSGLSGAAAVADAVLWGKEMPPADATAGLPRNVQSQLAEYRDRERAFRSGLTPPPGATPQERDTYERRVGIERVVFCLFPRSDSARVAPQYALDADIEPDWAGMAEMPRREAKFIDSLLADLPKPWLAPYLNLVAGHRKLCAGEMDGSAADARSRALTADGRRQLTRARDSGNRVIRLVAEQLLASGRCGEP
ncbi:MAG: hypothetical protein JWL71_1665 [Acidobacteria bacterium]|nr:hypothetical protein [Acidobacteriota bacterium]